MSLIYICASNLDRDAVLSAVGALEAAGHKCCVPGRDFDMDIDWLQNEIDAVNESELILVFDSDNARCSFRIYTERQEIAKSGLLTLTFEVGSFDDAAVLKAVAEAADRARVIKEQTSVLVPYEGDKDYIFLSHTAEDAERIRPIVRSLQHRGYRVWFDSGSAEPGREQDDIIAAHLENAAYMIPFFSAAYFENENCKDELFFERELMLDILPIFLEDVVLPPRVEMRFGRRQALFFHKYRNKEDFYCKVDAAQGIGSCREEPSPLDPGS